MRQLYNSSGQIIPNHCYDPFGNTISQSGVGNSTYGFTGEQQDGTGLDYLRARYYDPVTGRFLSQDAWGRNLRNPESQNGWSYAENNPALFTDPSGMSTSGIGNDRIWSRLNMEIIEIKRQIRAIFDPLARSLGMRGPIERDLFQYAEFKLGYLTDEIGIQIDVTLMSFFIFLLLFRPKGNSIPIGYEDDTGALQKLHLQDALKHLGIDSTKETKELQDLQGDSHNCSKMAEILARLLKEHWQTIRSTPDLWLLLDSREKEKQDLSQRKTAEIAWREKNYAKLIELYEAGGIVLSPEEKSRLEYARKQMRK